MTTIPETPAARTGKCSLTLSIDGRTYELRRAKPLSRGSKTWRLTVAAGQARAGLTYSVCTFNGKRRLHVPRLRPGTSPPASTCRHCGPWA